ncbi:rhamnan synthesis F family protein [Humibacillus xanthopallidus]|uniref:rhamnan synthesis F family protein n=1 Tax=Humibacillus xanthopallidus TaxID=412689 RepID=UPI001639D907|nr:rhamnan synthesis F family protein [Humibacillus xanthopallidus]
MRNGVAGRVRRSVRLRTRLRDQRDWWAYRRTFTQSLARDIDQRRESDNCVVVHLYHVHLWPEISSHIRRLPDSALDVFITTPPEHLAAARAAVGADFRARLISVPNRGRDVLPFIKTARILEMAGYSAVLKLHSKESVHHPDAAGWFGRLLDQLLPADEALTEEVLKTLAVKGTGVIGPQDSYYPSRHYLSRNRDLIAELVGELYGPSRGTSIMDVRLPSLGYFAGTMFWARLDAISSVLSVAPQRFVGEGGQVDATMAHALERLFTFVPQIEGRSVYTMGQRGLRRVMVPGPPHAGRTGPLARSTDG